MRLALSLAVLSFFLGCTRGDAPKTAPVEGVVTLAGQPLPDAGVTFLPVGKGPTTSGTTNDKGQFTLHAPIGQHKIAIGNAHEGPRKAGSPKIPEKYGSPDTTDLNAEVKAGRKNVFTFDLKS